MRPLSRCLVLAAAAAVGLAVPAAAQVEVRSGGATPGFRANAGPAGVAAAGTGVDIALGGTYGSSGTLVAPGGLLHVEWDGAVTEPVGPATWGTAGARGIATGTGATSVVALSRAAKAAAVRRGAVVGEQALAGAPHDVAVTRDGARWVTLPGRNEVVRWPIAGAPDTFSFPPLGGIADVPSGIAADGAGRVWVTLHGTERLAVIDPRPVTPTTAYVLLPADSKVRHVALGPDGRIWGTDEKHARLLAVDPGTLRVSSYQYGRPDVEPSAIAAGPDGVIYFAVAKDDEVGRVRPDGTFLPDVPTGLAGEKVEDVAPGGDGNVWFAVAGGPGHVGRVLLAPAASGVEVAQADDGLRVTGQVHPRARATDWRIEYGPAGSFDRSVTGSVPAGPAPVEVTATLPEPPTGTPWRVRLVAASPSGTATGPEAVTPAGRPAHPNADEPDGGGDDGDATAPARLDGRAEPPALGKRVVVATAKGRVLVTLPGTTTPVALEGADDVPVGAVLDTRRGTVRLRSAVNKAGKVQTAEFWGGVFAVRQSGTMTELHLRGPAATCARPGARAAAARRRVTRRLWGRDRRGRFRTHGRDSVATVRGTRWLVEETCTRTVTRVVEGAVVVFDRGTRKRVLVRAGRGYSARRVAGRAR